MAVGLKTHDHSGYVNLDRSYSLSRPAAYGDAKSVLVHPFVIIGEIALGSMKSYDQIIASLSILPGALTAKEEEVRFMIKRFAIMESGIGYVDAHLLASTLLTDDALPWTRDKRLQTVASRLDVAWQPN